MSLTTSQQARFDYLQNAYPHGLRGNAGNSDSVLYIYDTVRAIFIDSIQNLIQAQGTELSVSTAVDGGLTAWEQFLGLPDGSLLALNVRRSRILAVLFNNDGTIQSLRTAIEAFLPPGTPYEIQEMFALPDFSDPALTWSYLFTVPPSALSDADFEILMGILENIQPAHCIALLNFLAGITDTAYTVDSGVVTAVHPPFTWADEGVGYVPGDADRGDETMPLLAGPLRS